MFKTILVANDGSAGALVAAEAASDLAVKYDADLVMVYVIPERFLVDALQRYAAMEPLRILDDVQTGDVQERMKVMAHDAAQHDDNITRSSEQMGQHVLVIGEHVAKEKGVEKIKTYLESGDPVREVIKHAEFTNADLIVVGRSGHASAHVTSVGSTANKIIHRANCACLVVGGRHS